MENSAVSKTSKCARLSRVLSLILLGSAFAVWAADPVLGTWELNVAKSKYNPGPAPKSQTRIYEALPEGMKVTIKTVNADGQSTVVEHPANFTLAELETSQIARGKRQPSAPDKELQDHHQPELDESCRRRG